MEASQPILSKTEDRGDDGQISPHIRELLRGLHQERIERYEAGLEAGRVIEQYEESYTAQNCSRRQLFEAERAATPSLRDEGKIGVEVMRRIERHTDPEELRFSG